MKRTRFMLFASILTALVFSTAPTDAFGSWGAIETVSEDLDYDHTNLSMALDAAGYVHITYHWSQDIMYATNKSGSWVPITVPSANPTLNPFPSIAVDSAGKVHISYIGYAGTPGFDAELKYATNKSGSWVVTPVPTPLDLSDGLLTSIALDSSEKAHISYLRRYYDGPCEFMYATNKSGSWVPTTVDSGECAEAPSDHWIAIDSSDYVHISYSADSNLKYATNKSGSWMAGTVEPMAYPGSISIAIDNSDYVHISCAHFNYLTYWTNKSGAWVPEVVPIIEDFARYISIALDDSNKAHISHSGPNLYLEKDGVYYTTNASGGWVTETVVEDHQGLKLIENSIAVDDWPSVHIGYSQQHLSDLPSLKYVTESPFEAAVHYSVHQQPASVAIGHLDGDSDLDLAVANLSSNDVSVLLNNGNGTFQTAQNYAVGFGSGPYSVTVGDLNKDGDLDLAVANLTSGSVSVLFGNGNGTFQTAVNYATGDNSICVAMGYLNKDGDLDLAVANNPYGGGSVSVLLNNGDGTFETAVNYPAHDSANGVAIGYLNDDDDADLAVASFDGVSVLIGNGNGTFQAAVHYATGDGDVFGSVCIGDLDKDDAQDLAVTNRLGNTVSILLGNGDGTFQAAQNYLAGGAPLQIALGGLNADDVLEVVVADESNETVYLLPGNGDGTFQARKYSGVGVGPYSVALGDLDGDGVPDLAVANVGDNSVSVLINESTSACNDVDGDDYGDPASPICAHSTLDCDNSNPRINPGVAEGPPGSAKCSDGLDNDCDGLVDSVDPGCISSGSCTGSVQASAYHLDSIYEPSDLVNHIAYFILPVGAVIALGFWRRKR